MLQRVHQWSERAGPSFHVPSRCSSQAAWVDFGYFSLIRINVVTPSSHSSYASESTTRCGGDSQKPLLCIRSNSQFVFPCQWQMYHFVLIVVSHGLLKIARGRRTMTDAWQFMPTIILFIQRIYVYHALNLHWARLSLLLLKCHASYFILSLYIFQRGVWI